jgi:hypothetical protein
MQRTLKFPHNPHRFLRRNDHGCIAGFDALEPPSLHWIRPIQFLEHGKGKDRRHDRFDLLDGLAAQFIVIPQGVQPVPNILGFDFDPGRSSPTWQDVAI